MNFVRHTRFLFLLLNVFLFQGAFAQENVFTKTLANGFTIYVMENHDQPQVYGAVAVRTGSKHDPPDATGMAHYLEHVLFKGTTEMGTTDYEKEKVWLDSITWYYEKLGQTKEDAARLKIQLRINELSIKAGEYAIANEMDRMLAEMGATGVNAYTMVESTVYHNNFPSNQLERWMEIYAHRFQHPVFRLFQSELETVYEEKNRKMDDPFFPVFEYYLKQFFKKHPYGQQSTIGETEHLKNPPLKRIYEYFNTYYVPNNMALVLCGDVQHEEVFALAEKKFGTMVAKPIPAFPAYTEAPFKGKEKINVRKTPFPGKGGVIGFRLPKNTDPDMPVLDVIADLLSNNASAGSIDKLVNDGKILMGGLEYMPYNDGGTAFLYFVPRIIIQSIGKSEKLVMGCVNEIKSGKLSDDALAAVKTNRIKGFELSLESNTAGATNLINAYVKGVSPAEYFSYPEKIDAITREDIVRVANKYFGENSLTMYSRSGKSKKDKLSKPPFKPVVPKNETHSAYYHQWKKIPEQDLVPHYVDAAKEIDSVGLAKNAYLLRNQNQVNKVANLQLVFGTGDHYIPLLQYAAMYLELCGTKQKEVNTFNQKLYTLGCTHNIQSGSSQFVVKLNFPEENLNEVLALFKELLSEPRMEKKTVNKVSRKLFLDKFVDGRSADYYSDALNAYVMYGEKSPYLDHLGRKAFKHTPLQTLEKALGQVWHASLKVIYTGTLSNEAICEALQKNGFVFDRAAPEALYMIPKVEIKHNTVYLLNMRKARQSQVSLVKLGDPYTLEKTPVINAFNKYFGGDMSSLIFQEVREFRSLAYSTSAGYGIPVLQGYRGSFTASAGTQNDKTNECIDILYSLVNNMPLHPERMESIRSSLIQMTAAARPSFRNLIPSVENWKRKGYPGDPAQYNGERYPKLSFSDIEKLYEQELKNKPTAVCVTGKLKAFDTGALKKYGTVKKMKKKKLMKN